MSVLKENGLRHFWSQILAKLNEKVDKIGGKDLSTNDFTNEYKTKLDSIESGAQVNIQADWQQNDETANDYVKNRPGGYEGSPENVLSETTFSGTSATLDMALVLGYTYIVTFDGIEYVSTAKRDGAYPIFIGNTTYAWHGTITDDPFCILGNTNPCTINCDPGDHTVKVDKINIVKIPEKYLDIKNTNIVNGSAKGSLRTVGSTQENTSYKIGDYAFAEGSATQASGGHSHAEGRNTKALGSYSHAEGSSTTASGDYSHAEGYSTTASGNYSHAEGNYTKALGVISHAEGNSTIASGSYSHAEGDSTTALGDYSHAEGNSTVAGQMGFKVTACKKLTDTTGTYTLTSVDGLSVNQRYSVHLSSSKDNCGKITAINTDTNTITVDGYPNIALSPSSSPTANYLTIVGNPKLGDIKVSGDYSHAEGGSTQASSDYQHVQGKYNIEDNNNIYADIIGNGDVDLGTRSNAATVDWQGNAWYAGDVYVGSTSGTNKDEGSKKLATEEYIDTQIGDINTALDSIIEIQNSLIGGN